MTLREVFRFQVGLCQSYLSCYPHFGGNTDFRGLAVFYHNGPKSATYRLGRPCENEKQGGCEHADYQLQSEIRATERCQAAGGGDRRGDWSPCTHLLFSQEYELTQTRWEGVFSGGLSKVVGKRAWCFISCFLDSCLLLPNYPLIMVLNIHRALALGQTFPNTSPRLSHLNRTIAL